MPKTILKAAPRQITGRQVKSLRRQGLVPANVFGKDIKSTNVQISERDLVHFLKQSGESTLVYLQVEGEKSDRPVMISEVRRDPVVGRILHVGWHQVNLKEKVTAAIPVKLTGTAPAEQQHLGILVRQLAEIEAEALPVDIPESVEVDISNLKEVDDAIYVKDLKLDSKLAVKSDPEAIVVKIESLAEEEVVAAPPTPAVVEGGEVKEAESKVEGEKTEAAAPAS